VASSIVAIGDELLAGFTLDTNSHWLAERLRILGYPGIAMIFFFLAALGGIGLMVQILRDDRKA